MAKKKGNSAAQDAAELRMSNPGVKVSNAEAKSVRKKMSGSDPY